MGEWSIIPPDSQYARQGPLQDPLHARSTKYLKCLKSRRNQNQSGKNNYNLAPLEPKVTYYLLVFNTCKCPLLRETTVFSCSFLRFHLCPFADSSQSLSLPHLATQFNLRLTMATWMSIGRKGAALSSSKRHFKRELLISPNLAFCTSFCLCYCYSPVTHT